MNMFVTRLGTLALGALVFAGAARAAEPVTLKYKWVKGDIITYRMTTDTKMKMTGTPMGDMEGTQKQVMTTRMEIKDVSADSAATVVMTFESVKMEMDQPMMGKIAYDSESKENAGGPFAASYGALVGQAMTFVIEPSGAVRSASGMDAIVKKMTDAVEKEMPGAGGRMGEQLKGTFGDDAMRRTYEQALKIIPDKPVNVGDSWKTAMEQPLPGMGTMKSDITSTYQGSDKADGRNVAKIANTVAITMEPAKEAADMGAKITVKDGKGDGVNLFDIDRGQIHRGSANVNMPMEIVVAGPDGKEMTINQIVTAKTLIERIENSKPKAEKPAEPEKK